MSESEWASKRLQKLVNWFTEPPGESWIEVIVRLDDSLEELCDEELLLLGRLGVFLDRDDLDLEGEFLDLDDDEFLDRELLDINEEMLGNEVVWGNSDEMLGNEVVWLGTNDERLGNEDGLGKNWDDESSGG